MIWGNRKPWSVALAGMESGLVSPPLDFWRFRTMEEAQAWVDIRNANVGENPLTVFMVVDLRQP